MYLEAKGYGSHLWNILFVSQMTEGGLKKKKHVYTFKMLFVKWLYTCNSEHVNQCWFGSSEHTLFYFHLVQNYQK